MMVFNGASSTEVSIILQFEKILLAPTVIYCTCSILFYFTKSLGMHELWRRTPAYLIFILCLVNSLTISGFLAFYLVQENMGKAAEAFELIPLWVGISSSIGLLLSFSFLRLNKPYSSYQDRLKARQVNFTQKN